MDIDTKKRLITFFASITALVLLVFALAWLSEGVDPQTADAIAAEFVPQTRYTNGYTIKTIAGQDYISTEGPDGTERLTLLPKTQEEE